MEPVVIHRNRTEILQVKLRWDVSVDEYKSEIRAGKHPNSEKLAEWEIDLLTDGSDGELLLKLDNSVTKNLAKGSAYMDILRISGGEPLPVFNDSIPVVIRDSVTAFTGD